MLTSPAGEATVPFEAMVKQRDFHVERIERVFGTGSSILLPPDSLKRGYNRIEQFLVQEEGRSLQLLYRVPDDPDAPPGSPANAGSQGGNGDGGGQDGS